MTSTHLKATRRVSTFAQRHAALVLARGGQSEPTATTALEKSRSAADCSGHFLLECQGFNRHLTLCYVGVPASMAPGGDLDPGDDPGGDDGGGDGGWSTNGFPAFVPLRPGSQQCRKLQHKGLLRPHYLRQPFFFHCHISHLFSSALQLSTWYFTTTLTLQISERSSSPNSSRCLSSPDLCLWACGSPNSPLRVSSQALLDPTSTTTTAAVACPWLGSSTSKSSPEFPCYSASYGCSHSRVASSTGQWTSSSRSLGSPHSVSWFNGPTGQLATATLSTGTKLASAPSVVATAQPKHSPSCLLFSGSAAPLSGSGSFTVRGARLPHVTQAILAADGITAAVCECTNDINVQDEYWRGAGRTTTV